MAETTAQAGGISERYHFLIRRLHSLSGIVPVGVFLCVHLSVNASILAGGSAFQFAVDQIHNLNKLGILKAVELVFIIIPIAFHAIMGVIIWLSSQPNVLAYPYGGNVRYTLQRWTGLVTVGFILVHLWHMHWLGAPFPGGNQFDPHHAPQTALLALEGWWTGPAYAIGVLCAVYHLANGIWTFLITWGITIGPRSQRLSGIVCVIIGLVLGFFGLGSLIKFKTMEGSVVPSAEVAQGAPSLPNQGPEGPYPCRRHGLRIAQRFIAGFTMRTPNPSPVGTAEMKPRGGKSARFIRPYGTWTPADDPVPSVETLGYSHSSLRDEANTCLLSLGDQSLGYSPFSHSGASAVQPATATRLQVI